MGTEAEVEKAAIEHFQAVGWKSVNVQGEVLGEKGTLGRKHQGQVVLEGRLRQALEKLNPGLPAQTIKLALEELIRDRSAMTLVAANKELWGLLRDGVSAKVARGGKEEPVKVRVVDWSTPENNDFLLAQQFVVAGKIQSFRTDLVGFVNGLPLVFVELKGTDHPARDAFDKNFSSYRSEIPQLFWFNAVVILSNGLDAVVGSVTGGWSHFKPWKRKADEEEEAGPGLETMVEGMCHPACLLDLIENFTLFSDVKGTTAKIVGQNHQMLGVNNAIRRVLAYRAALDRGATAEALTLARRIGVFWHTQGSGKSFSMVFFAQKVLRKIKGNWTFVVITDRAELDEQIYTTFQNTGAVNEVGVQAGTAEHLRQLLQGDHRYVFTLIQKFRPETPGKAFPRLSERSDIIVMADEAHRSQYDIFSENMRYGLVNAAFMGFTGTPLMQGERITEDKFGGYVSKYPFWQAIEDGATVPLYYEATIPEMQIDSAQFKDGLEDILDEAELSDAQRKKLEQDFGQQYQVLTQQKRIDALANNIMEHFLGRKPWEKAMVVCLDKATTVRMFTSFEVAWKGRIKQLEERLAEVPHGDKQTLKIMEDSITLMKQMDRAVVVSRSQFDVQQLAAKWPHLKGCKELLDRASKEDLASRFKKPDDPLRLVFVCAMWITGFDAPSCSVVYLDKPMKNHTLMQTIARANRVHPGKECGIIVDYIGVFQNLEAAFKLYAGEGTRSSEKPIDRKDKLVGELEATIKEALLFCTSRGIDLEAIRAGGGAAFVKASKQAVNRLVHPEETRSKFLALCSKIDRLFSAIGVEPRKQEFAASQALLHKIEKSIRATGEGASAEGVMARIEELLGRSISISGEFVGGSGVPDDEKQISLRDMSRAALEKIKASEFPEIDTQAAIGETQRRAGKASRENPTLVGIQTRLDDAIRAYNKGATKLDAFLDELGEILERIEKEEARAQEEGLSREELVIYDILVACCPDLPEDEHQTLKAIAHELIKHLPERLVLDWRKNEQKRAAILALLDDVFQALPGQYEGELYVRTRSEIFKHIYESYWGNGKSKYSSVL
jgi:type I restriction enzyme R subunit